MVLPSFKDAWIWPLQIVHDSSNENNLSGLIYEFSSPNPNFSYLLGS